MDGALGVVKAEWLSTFLLPPSSSHLPISLLLWVGWRVPGGHSDDGDMESQSRLYHLVDGAPQRFDWMLKRIVFTILNSPHRC